MEEEEKKKKNKRQEQEETISNFSTRDAEAPVQPQRHSFFSDKSQKWHFRNLRKAIKSLLGPAYSSRDVQSVIKTAPNRHDSF